MTVSVPVAHGDFSNETLPNLTVERFRVRGEGDQSTLELTIRNDGSAQTVFLKAGFPPPADSSQQGYVWGGTVAPQTTIPANGRTTVTLPPEPSTNVVEPWGLVRDLQLSDLFIDGSTQ